MLELPKQNRSRPLATPAPGGLHFFLVSAACVVLGVLALGIDLPVSLACKDIAFPGDSEILRLITLSEVFAHGTGVALICITVLVLDRARRRAVLRLVAGAYASGIAADIFKLCVKRIRPAAFTGDQILDTFRLASLPQIKPIESWALASFPSAHSATAVGLAVGLVRLYPQGRWLFFAFTLLACSQRIVSRAHWPSDVLWGAAVGFFISALIYDRRLMGQWFDRWETGALRRPT